MMPRPWLSAALLTAVWMLPGCREEPLAAPVASAGADMSAAPPLAPVAIASASASPPIDAGRRAAATATLAACPPDMVLVEGEACSSLRQNCVRWLDDPKLPYARCARYDRHARCVGSRKRLRYCIDREELTLPGERLPVSDLSFTRASGLCRSRGRRMCLESEWTLACEGEERRPYPYGWERRPVCNQDKADLLEAAGTGKLADQRAPADAFPECVSPFGVHNMVGNVDELVERDAPNHAGRFRNLLKGGWWMPARNRCRPATGDHDDYFHELQIGTRCCADASDAQDGTPARN